MRSNVLALTEVSASDGTSLRTTTANNTKPAASWRGFFQAFIWIATTQCQMLIGFGMSWPNNFYFGEPLAVAGNGKIAIFMLR